MKSLTLPALISLPLISPFVILELVNQPKVEFPYFLFFLLWALAVVFIAMLKPVARQFSVKTNVAAKFSVLFVGVTLLALVAALWIGIVQDQMPCFYGVPICD